MTKRQRTIEWEDPRVHADAARRMSGRKFLQAMLDGELPPPPIAKALDLALVEVGDGRAVFEFQPAEFHYNPLGSVQGGVPAVVFDAALGCAIQTRLPDGVGYTTVELSLNLVRAITADTPRLRCVGEAVHVGRRLATARADLRDADGTLYAHASTTCMVFTPTAEGAR